MGTRPHTAAHAIYKQNSTEQRITDAGV